MGVPVGGYISGCDPKILTAKHRSLKALDCIGISHSMRKGCSAICCVTCGPVQNLHLERAVSRIYVSRVTLRLTISRAALHRAIGELDAVRSLYFRRHTTLQTDPLGTVTV